MRQRLREHPLPKWLSLLFFGIFPLFMVVGWVVIATVRVMDNDELMGLYLDSLPSVRQLWSTQMHWPISLEPPAYHLLAHACVQMFGPTAIAMRLPALAGYLLMLICLYLFVRRLAGSQAAMTAVPMAVIFSFSQLGVLGRPYGLMIGLQMLVLLCWSTVASKPHLPAVQRSLLLCLLAFALFLATTTHYFGFIILIPLLIGEGTRILCRKRLDLQMLGAIAGGSLGLIVAYLFSKAVAPYKAAYLPQDTLTAHKVFAMFFFTDYGWSKGLQIFAEASFYLFIVLLVCTQAWALRKHFREDGPVWMAVLALGLLPLFAMSLKQHAELHYVPETAIAFVILIAAVGTRFLRAPRVAALSVSLVIVAAVAVEALHVRSAILASRAWPNEMTLPPAVQALLDSQPERLIYVQRLERFFMGSYYLQPPDLRSRVSLVFSGKEELRLVHTATSSVTAQHLQHFTALQTETYEALLRRTDGPLVVVFDDPALDWLPQSLKEKHIRAVPLGKALGGNLFRLCTPATTSCDQGSDEPVAHNLQQ